MSEKQQNQQNSIDPKSELFQRGVTVFMGNVTQETMSPLVDWIIASNFNIDK